MTNVSPEEDRPYWVLFTMVPGVGPVRFQRLLAACGSARAAWSATDLQLAMAGLDRRSAEGLRQLRAKASPAAAVAQLERLRLRALTLLDEGYPAPLRQIIDPPSVLYVRGRLAEGDAVAVALVGTRRASPYGRAVAELLARGLVAAGVTVVSGLAKGVDAVAHRAALDAGGRTVAVLGNGPDQVYPPENTGLAQRIVERDAGAVVSEFAPGAPPDAGNFPRRNRIISGLCAATVIVEAGQRSGALITADFALEQGRDVLAVPGSILSPLSAGANSLIRDGATPVTGVEDVLQALRLVPDKRAARTLPLLAGDEAAVYDALGGAPRHVDDLSRALGLRAAEVAATLTVLELRGLARPVGPLAYVRR